MCTYYIILLGDLLKWHEYDPFFNKWVVNGEPWNGTISKFYETLLMNGSGFPSEGIEQVMGVFNQLFGYKCNNIELFSNDCESSLDEVRIIYLSTRL